MLVFYSHAHGLKDFPELMSSMQTSPIDFEDEAIFAS